MRIMLRISRNNGKPPQMAKCEMCLTQQRGHFRVGLVRDRFLCVRCGLYLKMFPTEFISQAVHNTKPKNTLAKLLFKSALISVIPVCLYSLGASTTAMLASMPSIALSALAFYGDGKTASGKPTPAGLLNDAIDHALNVIKRHSRVLASRFYVSDKDELAELFETYKSQIGDDFDRVANCLKRVDTDLEQIKLRLHHCDDHFLEDLGLDHLPRNLVREAMKELIQEQLKKNLQGDKPSNEASGELRDEATASGQSNEREDEASNRLFEGSEASGERRDEPTMSGQSNEREDEASNRLFEGSDDLDDYIVF